MSFFIRKFLQTVKDLSYFLGVWRSNCLVEVTKQIGGQCWWRINLSSDGWSRSNRFWNVNWFRLWRWRMDMHLLPNWRWRFDINFILNVWSLSWLLSELSLINIRVLRLEAWISALVVVTIPVESTVVIIDILDAVSSHLL